MLKIINTAKQFPTIVTLLGHNRKIFLHLSRFYSRVASASKRPGVTLDFNCITFDGLLMLSRDFEVVPRICSMSELQHIFHHTATNQHAKKLNDSNATSQHASTGFNILHDHVSTFFLGVSIATTDQATKRFNQPNVGERMRLRGARKTKQGFSLSHGVSFRDEDNWTEELLSHRYTLLLKCMNTAMGSEGNKEKAEFPIVAFGFCSEDIPSVAMKRIRVELENDAISSVRTLSNSFQNTFFYFSFNIHIFNLIGNLK